MIYVLDASIVLTVILEMKPKLVEDIKTLLRSAKNGKYKLISSDFLKIEVANGLRFNEKNKNKAEKLFQHYVNLPIAYLPLETVILEKSLSTAFVLGTTVYDTSYHILAKAQGAIFLTCDSEYYKKAKELGDIELIS